MKAPTLPISQLRLLYNALLSLKEQEQTALAELHAEDPTLLLHRFRDSVRVLADLPPIDHPFYEGVRKPLASPPIPVDDIRTTHDFASQLADKPCRVAGAEELDFFYIDREISPLRTPTTDAPRRSLDLLLGNVHDRTPIFAELKIAGDKLAYVALVQVLMLAVELVVPAQRARLLAHPPADGLFRRDSPLADLYLIGFKSPERGRYRQRSVQAAERIAEQLIADSLFATFVRRIAYLDAAPASERMTWVKRFAFGSGL